MRKIRIIPRLDIKYPNLIKGVRLEGLRVVGDPEVFANDYYIQGADELLYMDTVASLYERNTIGALIEKTANNIFIPLTVGGGIRTVDDAKRVLRMGADKVSLNSEALKKPHIINQLSDSFGNQCVVLNVEAQKISEGKWEAFYDNGREKSGIDVLKWIEEIQDRGAGEIMVTAINQEGTQSGFDIELMKKICEIARVPVIASGGMGTVDHLRHLIEETTVDAVAIAHVLHYKNETILSIKTFLEDLGLEIRL